MIITNALQYKKGGFVTLRENEPRHYCRNVRIGNPMWNQQATINRRRSPRKPLRRNQIRRKRLAVSSTLTSPHPTSP